LGLTKNFTSEAESPSILPGSGLASQYQTSPERFAMDKHSNLLGIFKVKKAVQFLHNFTDKAVK
jgi:hypothetical protein